MHNTILNRVEILIRHWVNEKNNRKENGDCGRQTLTCWRRNKNPATQIREVSEQKYKDRWWWIELVDSPRGNCFRESAMKPGRLHTTIAQKIRVVTCVEVYNM